MRATAILYIFGAGRGRGVWKWGNIPQSVDNERGQRKNIPSALGISRGNTYFCTP